jgi:hypothetical protein
MRDRDTEYLLDIARDFSGKDADYLKHVAMHGTRPEKQAAIYQAQEMISGRRKHAY